VNQPAYRQAGLILASKSPRRRALLKALGLSFRVMPSGVPEDSREKRPGPLVRELALRKAQAVAKRVKKGVVLGADTVVVLAGHILGQPKDPDDAYRMLYRLAGSTHRVYTGVAVVDAASGARTVSHAVSTVRMKKLPLDTLLRLARKNLDKAGAYAIQNKNDPIARVASGKYDNVVGLPLTVVSRLLKPYRLPKTLPKRRIPS
jgi:septum formation protein